MPQQRVVRCSNCGTTWTPAAQPGDQDDASVSVAACPVCKLPLPIDETALTTMSADDLSTQLSVLITSARASGLDAVTIIHALSDELEFAAEFANPGRDFCVQLIDLGPLEGATVERPVRDRRAMLQTRSVN